MTIEEGPPGDPRAGARNLLLGCVRVRTGEDVLIIREDARLGYYDAAAGDCVAEVARELGARVQVTVAPEIEGPEDFPAALAAAMRTVDHTIFFSRIGDRLRFCPIPGPGSKTMSYALDIGFLGAALCRVPHELLSAVHERFVGALNRAGEWRITCPLGTDARGRLPADGPAAPPNAGDAFSLRTFPVMIFAPVSCATMSGRVALSHWLMSTMTHDYENPVLMLDEPVFALVENGRVAGFEGGRGAVAKIEDHYRRLGAHFGVDAYTVGSWHAGINPATFYPTPARDDVERWGGVAFGSPRYTHFHGCGTDPGEIAWSVFDTTIALDGEDYWRDGRFVFLDRHDQRALLTRYPGAARTFEMHRDIGL